MNNLNYNQDKPLTNESIEKIWDYVILHNQQEKKEKKINNKNEIIKIGDNICTCTTKIKCIFLVSFGVGLCALSAKNIQMSNSHCHTRAGFPHTLSSHQCTNFHSSHTIDHRHARLAPMYTIRINSRSFLLHLPQAEMKVVPLPNERVLLVQLRQA